MSRYLPAAALDLIPKIPWLLLSRQPGLLPPYYPRCQKSVPLETIDLTKFWAADFQTQLLQPIHVRHTLNKCESLLSQVSHR